MEISLRPIPHSHDEIAMGHCISYPPIKTDAIACTYNMDGFSPMKAVLRAHCIDTAHFHKCRRYHSDGRFRTISHGDEFPNIITSSKTATWDEVPDAADRIIFNVEDQYCKSLCMTHFAFLSGEFPAKAFTACMHAVNMARTYTKLQKIIVDVDERFFAEAMLVWQQVRQQVSHEN